MRGKLLITAAVMTAGAHFPAATSAGPAYFETEWDLTWFGQFDYVCKCYEDYSNLPKSSVIARFPSEVYQSIDYGLATITYFGYLGDTKLDLPLLNLVGPDPIGGGLSHLGKQAYTFPNVSDYSTFIEQFAFQDNIYSWSEDLRWAFHTSLRATRRTTGRGGDGSNDYAFTTTSLAQLFGEIQTQPTDFEIIFSQYWNYYAVDGSNVTYFAGKGWSALATLSSWRLVSAIPEPETWLTMIAGFGVIGSAFRRRGRYAA